MGTFTREVKYTHDGRFPLPFSSIWRYLRRSTDTIDLVELCCCALGVVAVTRVAEHEEACFVIVPYKVLHRPTPNTVLARVYRAEPTLASVLALSSFKDFSALHTQHATTIQLKRYIKFDKPIESAFGAGQLSRTARNTKKALATGYVCTAGRFSVPQDYLDSLLSDHTS